MSSHRKKRNKAKSSNLVKTLAGNNVQSWTEAKIDDWLYHRGFDFEYEPDVNIEGIKLKPDWVVLGRGGWKFSSPILIEYWGLLRYENRAQWLITRLPKYLERKTYKESLYNNSKEYYYFGVDPRFKSDIHSQLQLNLTEAIKSQFTNEI